MMGWRSVPQAIFSSAGRNGEKIHYSKMRQAEEARDRVSEGQEAQRRAGMAGGRPDCFENGLL